MSKQGKKVVEKEVQQPRRRGEKGYNMSPSLKFMATLMNMSKEARRLMIQAEIASTSYGKNVGKTARAELQAQNG